MVDSLLFAALLKAMTSHARLLLIGDQNQLPSVSSGKVLQDLIESQRFPLYCLDTIYRQSQGSGIALLPRPFAMRIPCRLKAMCASSDAMPNKYSKPSFKS